ncbi:MAG: aminoacyl-tRNA hydrolase [Opitutae bacterium]|jgi:PTH1 family peptidyl-tRNA hydrolase|nr:aminoacyl-tRNA hydrolase [Opitutae bacterium]
MAVKVIVGLGNPGDDYKNSRHNLGFALVDRLARHFSFNWKFDKKFNAEIAEGIYKNQKLSLIKPQTFMNLSGHSVQKFKEYHKLSNDAFLVAYDDYNLNLGQSKLKIGGADGGHNGISSIILQIGVDFPRFRLGIHPKCNVSLNLSDFVLGRFDLSEQQILDTMFTHWIEDVRLILGEGIEKAMNQTNKRNTVEHEEHSE